MPELNDYVLDGLSCPTCGRTNDGFADANGGNDGQPPDENSISICFYCLTFSVFHRDAGDTLRLRPVTDDEMARIQNDQNARDALAALICAKITMNEREAPGGSEGRQGTGEAR